MLCFSKFGNPYHASSFSLISGDSSISRSILRFSAERAEKEVNEPREVDLKSLRVIKISAQKSRAVIGCTPLRTQTFATHDFSWIVKAKTHSPRLVIRYSWPSIIGGCNFQDFQVWDDYKEMTWSNSSLLALLQLSRQSRLQRNGWIRNCQFIPRCRSSKGSSPQLREIYPWSL